MLCIQDIFSNCFVRFLYMFLFRVITQKKTFVQLQKNCFSVTWFIHSNSQKDTLFDVTYLFYMEIASIPCHIPNKTVRNLLKF